MKCPKCQKELTEGKLYCELCGNEIQIVPDFDPQVEGSIRDTLSNLAEGFKEDREVSEDDLDDFNNNYDMDDFNSDYDMDDSERPNILIILIKLLLGQKKVSFIFGFIIIIVVFIFGFYGLKVKKEDTFNFQYKNAIHYADGEAYIDAIASLENALTYEPNNSSARLLLGDYYMLNKDSDNAILIYKELLSDSSVSSNAYKSIIEYYITQGKYAVLDEFLKDCKDVDIVNKYQEYIAATPQFSLSEGTYEEISPLKITTNTSGIVYYTTDGTQPNEGSNVYTAPIMLESGIYEVKAFFKNTYGITSDVIKAQYCIDVKKLSAPVVNVEDGNYNLPIMIEVEVPKYCSVYYTTDGSTPTKDSIQYVRPIPMPLGKSSYQFLTYSQEDVPSEVTARTLVLDLDARFSKEEAVLVTLQGLVSNGSLTDLSGHVEEMSGRNVYYCSSAFMEDSETYYLVTEYYEDLTGRWYYTGNRYAVNISTGVLFKTELNSENYIHVLSLL